MSKAANDLSSFENLQPPDTRIRGLIRNLGPGLILMMTGVGTSHLVTAPVAGGRWEFALLWVLPISYLFKYFGFELAFRFTNATGYSILDAACTTRGKWMLWYVMIVTIVQSALGQAGRVVAAAAVLYFGFTDFLGWNFDLWVYGLAIGILSWGLVQLGSYGAVEKITKIAILFLVASAIWVFLAAPPPAASYVHFFIFETPAGSWFVLGSFLGLLPTGIDVSLQTSEWTKTRNNGMSFVRRQLEQEGKLRRFDPFHPRMEDIKLDVNTLPSNAQTYVRRWFKIGIIDFNVGHWLSLILAFIFMTLAAMWIYPSNVEGKGVMGEIAGIFTSAIGPYMMWIFLVGAMAATWSTVINYFDGWPRVVASCCRNLFKGTAKYPGVEEASPEAKKVWYSEHNLWRLTSLFSLVGSCLIIIGLPKPVYLVLLASVLSLVIAPVIYFYNYWFCLKAIPKGDKFYPKAVTRILIWGSMIVFAGATLIVIVQKFM